MPRDSLPPATDRRLQMVGLARHDYLLKAENCAFPFLAVKKAAKPANSSCYDSVKVLKMRDCQVRH